MHYMLIYFRRLRLISLAIYLFAKTFTVSFQLKETETKAIVRVFNETLTSIYLETSLPTRILNKCYFSSHLSRKFTHFWFVSPVWKLSSYIASPIFYNEWRWSTRLFVSSYPRDMHNRRGPSRGLDAILRSLCPRIRSGDFISAAIETIEMHTQHPFGHETVFLSYASSTMKRMMVSGDEIVQGEWFRCNRLTRISLSFSVSFLLLSFFHLLNARWYHHDISTNRTINSD